MVDLVICVGSSCHLKGAKNVVNGLQRLVKERRLEARLSLNGSFCMGNCSHPGVSVKLNGEPFFVEPEKVEQFFEDEVIKRVEAGR